MTPPRRTNLAVGATVLAAIAASTGAWIGWHQEGFGDGIELVIFAGVLSLSWAFPLFLLRREESEAFHVLEAFFVPMAVLLPPLATVTAFALAPLAGQVAHRRPFVRVVFNAAQLVVTVVAALTVTRLVLGAGEIDVTGRVVLAVSLGAVAFLVVNSAIVASVIAVADGVAVGSVLFDGIGIRIVVWASAASVGLLALLGGVSHRWALVAALLPLVTLHVVLHGYGRAHRDRQRMDGLFETAVEAHRSMGVEDVHQSLAHAAREQLRARSGEVRSSRPHTGELGAALPDGAWLIVGERLGVESYDDADQRLLEAIAAVGGTALENAQLFEQVAVERKKLADVVGSSSDGILSVDADQRISSWNAAMERITGFPAAEVVGSKCFTVYRPRDEEGRELCTAACPGRCGRNEEPQSVQVTTINGEQRWLSCTYSPLPDGGYVVVARDMTAQKAVDDLKADFLATISHELRTPLTPIQGFLHTLLREDTQFGDAERRRFYEVMLRQSERLERLVKDLLEATSLQDRDHLFLPEEVDWARVIGHVGELFTREHPDRELLVDLPDDQPIVVADEQRAEQVLLNLLANAAKYSPDGTPVRISVEVLGDEVVTTVADRGPGVPPADRDRIFERFTRLGDHLTRRVGGAGLGLFIARRLVEGMGGSITVGQAPEGGAAFSFSLPQYTGARQTH